MGGTACWTGKCPEGSASFDSGPGESEDMAIDLKDFLDGYQLTDTVLQRAAQRQSALEPNGEG